MAVETTLPPLATVGQLEARLGRELSDAERGQAHQWLQEASDSLRTVTGQTLTYVEGDLELHDGFGAALLQLRQLPVQEIIAVAAEGVELQQWRDWRIDLETGNLWRCRWPWPYDGAWWAGRQGIAVIYSHGYRPLPADLVGVALGMVGRALAAPAGDVRSEQLGPYRYDRGALAGLGTVGLSGAEARIVAKYTVRRQVIQ